MNDNYTEISVEKLLGLIRVDQSQNRDDLSPLDLRVRELNECEVDFRDREIGVVNSLLDRYGHKLDSIAVVRLIRYLTQVKANNQLISSSLRKCVQNHDCPVAGRLTAAHYLAKNYPSELRKLISEQLEVWRHLVEGARKSDPVRLARILTYLDLSEAQQLLEELLLDPGIEDEVVELLCELMGDDRTNKSHFHAWLSQLVDLSLKRVSEENQTILRSEKNSWNLESVAVDGPRFFKDRDEVFASLARPRNLQAVGY